MDVYEVRYRNLRSLIAQMEREAGRSGARAGGLVMLAERLGKQPAQVNHFASEKRVKNIGPKIAREIDAAFGHPEGWLDQPHWPADEDATQPDPSTRSQQVPRFETDGSYVRFPLLEGFAGMGKGDYVTDYPEVVESLRVSREWVERKLPGVPPEAIRVITGRGDSMRGQYNDGDLIFIDTRIRTFDQDSAYCFRWEGRVLVKRLQFVGRGMLRILSKNPDYPSIDAPIDEIEIGGRALAAWTLREF
ncbi:S24 family peptidase [Luteibacter sp. UNC138MFCol5.1]|uniref:S24 family peptidase n=1 Tax=Luteibacter sp. UNC138MFCol5.1 TaxID=1502774 RepID=UPI001160D52E|nr:S24 family peptidase [Luteibacter sp. UNC138MFCol5.1]